MAEWIKLTGAGATGRAGTAGTGGTAGAGPAAPNITSATIFVTYNVVGEMTYFGFSGFLILPTILTHLQTLSILALVPGTAQKIEITRFDNPTGVVNFVFKGSGSTFLQTDAIQTGWGVEVQSFNETGVLTLPSYIYPNPLTVVAATVSSVNAVDASTLLVTDADYQPRFQDSATALHTVLDVYVTLASKQYPQTVTIWIDKQDGKDPTWQGFWAVYEDNQLIQIGLPQDKKFERGSWITPPRRTQAKSHTDVYPPGNVDGSWKIIVAAGQFDAPPSSAFTSDPFSVPAIPVPGSNAATGAYIDKINYGNNGQVNTWGWDNLFTTLPYGDPNFFFARWTVQNGSLVGGVFTPGTTAQTAQHDGLEVPFTDDNNKDVLRQPGSNTVTLLNKLMWTLPTYKLADGSLNPNSCFRFRNYVGSRRDTDGSGGTLTLQNDWSPGVSDPGPGIADHFDVLLDLTKGRVSGHNLNPNHKLPSMVYNTGKGVTVNSADDTITLDLNQGAGLNFDITGKAQINAGAGLGFDIVTGKAILNQGAGIGIDGSNKAFIKLSGPLFSDVVTGNLSLRLAGDFTITGGPGTYTLSQASVNLALAAGFNTTNFQVVGSSFLVKNIAVDTLIAGNALFTGVATFAYNSGGAGINAVSISSLGITLADSIAAPTSTVTVTSTGATIAKGSNNIAIVAGGITISETGGASAAFNSSGAQIARSSNVLSATSSGITITRSGGGSLNMDYSGVLIANGTNSVNITSSLVTITGPSGTLLANSSGIKIANGNTSLLASSSGVTLTGNTTGVASTLNMDSNGLSFARGTNTVAISTSNITLTKTGTEPVTLDMNNTGLKLTGGVNTLLLSSSGLTINGPGTCVVKIDVNGFKVSNGTASVTVTATDVQLVNAAISIISSGATISLNPTNGFKVTGNGITTIVSNSGGVGNAAGLVISLDLLPNMKTYVQPNGVFLFSSVTGGLVGSFNLDTNSDGHLWVSGTAQADKGYQVGVSTVVIDSTGAFVGAGVICPTKTIGGLRFAAYNSGWSYGVVGPSSFTTADGKTATVLGGIIVSLI